MMLHVQRWFFEKFRRSLVNSSSTFKKRTLPRNIKKSVKCFNCNGEGHCRPSPKKKKTKTSLVASYLLVAMVHWSLRMLFMFKTLQRTCFQSENMDIELRIKKTKS